MILTHLHVNTGVSRIMSAKSLEWSKTHLKPFPARNSKRLIFCPTCRGVASELCRKVVNILEFSGIAISCYIRQKNKQTKQ